jgi:hypothetical protein
MAGFVVLLNLDVLLSATTCQAPRPATTPPRRYGAPELGWSWPETEQSCVHLFVAHPVD